MINKTMHEMEAETIDYLLEVDADLRATAGELFNMREVAARILNQVFVTREEVLQTRLCAQFLA
jgi:hypothetical protein